MDVLRAAELLSGIGKTQLDVDLNRCARSLSTKSTCDRCAEICPHGVITTPESFDTKVEDCDSCGLCAAACPTGAIQMSDGGPSSALERMPDEVNEVTVTCRRKGLDKNQSGLTVECIGQLDNWFFLVGISRGIVKFNVVASDCEDCDRSIKTDHISSAIQHFATVASHHEPSEAKRTRGVQADSVESGTHLSRRGFLGDMMLSVERLSGIDTKQATVSASRLGEVVESKNVPLDRRRGLAAIHSMSSTIMDQHPWAVDQQYVVAGTSSPCDGCGHCATLCPNGAMSRVESQGKSSILHTPAMCSGCSLCADICGQNALIVKSAATLEHAISVDSFVVITSTVSTCRSCGDVFPDSNQEKELCECCAKTIEVDEGFADMLGNR